MPLIQIDDLRSTIPSLVRATSKKTTSRSAYFANFQSATLGSQLQLSEFRRDWLSEGTQEILDKAEKRRDVDGDMRKSLDVPKYGWIDKERQAGQGKEGLANGQTKEEDMGKVFESWKEKHPDSKAEFLEDEHKITVKPPIGDSQYSTDSSHSCSSQRSP